MPPWPRGYYVYNRLIRHERSQQQQIDRLQGIVSEVRERVRRQQDYYDYQIVWSEKVDDFNYLAIGNSLTLITSWGRGICATAPDLDYYGLIVAYLRSSLNSSDVTVVTHSADNASVNSTENSTGMGSTSIADSVDKANVIAHRWNFAIWERASDRAAVLDLLNLFLSEHLDLVTLQLGENVPIYGSEDLTRYEKDLAELVDYIRSASPKAQVIIIDDFWSQEKSDVRRRVATVKGLSFADLTQIRGDKRYQSKAGTVCLIPAMSSSRSVSDSPGSSGSSGSSDSHVTVDTVGAAASVDATAVVSTTSISKDLQKSDGSEHSSQGNTPENEGTEDTERETGHALLEPILVSEEAATHPGDEGMKYIAEQVIEQTKALQK